MGDSACDFPYLLRYYAPRLGLFFFILVPPCKARFPRWTDAGSLFFLDGPQGVPLIAARSARAGIKLESHSWDPLAGHMGLVSDSFEMAFSMPKLVAAAGFDTSLI